MKGTVLYEDKKVVFEVFEDGQYKVTFFNEENHWAGDITFTKEEGVIYDSVKEPIDEEKLKSIIDEFKKTSDIHTSEHGAYDWDAVVEGVEFGYRKAKEG